jgi:hypothetical protein
MKIGDPIPCKACDGTGEVFNTIEYDDSNWRECEDCDGYGVEVTAWSRRCYLAISQESGAVGWPVRYREDLTYHDRRFCEAIGPATQVAWILRESGTHMVVPTPEPIDGAGNTAWGFIRDCFGPKGGMSPCRFYAWDGQRLRELPNAEKLAQWAESVALAIAYKRKREQKELACSHS